MWGEAAGAAAAVLGAFAAYRAGWSCGRVAMRNEKRQRVDLPRIPGGIMALVPPLVGPCPTCGVGFRRHPAMADKRCAGCVARALEADEERDIAQARADGWRQ